MNIASLTLSIALCASSFAYSQVPGAFSGPDAAPSTPSQSAFIEAHPGAGFFSRDGMITRVYGEAFSNGATPMASAENFLQSWAPIFGAQYGDLLAIGQYEDGHSLQPLMLDEETGLDKFTLVSYSQFVKGVPVFRSTVRCLVRNEEGSPLVLVSNELKNLGDFAASLTSKPVPPSRINMKLASRYAFNEFRSAPTVSAQEMVIWAGYEDAKTAKPVLAVKFIAEGGNVFDGASYQKFLFVVDAANGRILFQENMILSADLTINARGMGTENMVADACANEVSMALPYAKITYGTSTIYANVNGVAVAIIGASTAFTSTTSGRYFTMNNVPGAESSITTNSAGGVLDFMHNSANTVEGTRSEVNSYIHANLVRDLTLSVSPSYPTIATQLGFAINVGVAGTCNAFYDGSSINFYAAGGGCNNTAFGDVVHHEYGHHLVAVAGSGQGAYGEGMGDVMGVLMKDNPQLGVGFQSCATGIRDANNVCQYSATGCSSCGSEIHACGQLLSGCVWSLRNTFAVTYPSTYRTKLASLAVNAMPLHTGSSIAGDITIDYLTLNDNNGNIGDGTPDYSAINGAFTAHGLPGPAVQLLAFAYPSGIPTLSNPNGSTTVAVNVSALSATPAPGTGKMYWRNGVTGAYSVANMAQGAANQYTATIPALTCGSSLQFYFAANTSTGIAVTSPLDAPTTIYAASVGTGSSNTFVDTVETDLGWSLTTTGDTATTGQWVRADPVGTINGTVQVQPELDVTTGVGVNCFFTGQGTAGGTLGAADVDGGYTTLTSPTMSALGGEARVSYYRWYSNGQGGAPNADSFKVQISNNNGTTWISLEIVGPTGVEVDGGWIFKNLRIADYVTPTATMKLRFIAEDSATGSLIEAAVDEVRISVVNCGIAQDLNGDGVVNAADLAILLNNWGGSGLGDLDGNGYVDAADVAALLNAWG
ncbi:MAG: hypothetical protein EXS10_01500 [Phycisphaerales bacterium]|nr:hypothetical protein [Phycisphaerales bacterium]